MWSLFFCRRRECDCDILLWYMSERCISGLINTPPRPGLEDHPPCRPPHLLQLVTSTGFCAQSGEIFSKSTRSKRMINACCPSQQVLIIQRFTEPLIPLHIQGGEAVLRSIYDTWWSYFCIQHGGDASWQISREKQPATSEVMEPESLPSLILYRKKGLQKGARLKVIYVNLMFQMHHFLKGATFGREN